MCAYQHSTPSPSKLALMSNLFPPSVCHAQIQRTAPASSTRSGSKLIKPSSALVSPVPCPASNEIPDLAKWMQTADSAPPCIQDLANRQWCFGTSARSRALARLSR